MHLLIHSLTRSLARVTVSLSLALSLPLPLSLSLRLARTFQVRCSMLEIYNETINDLLDPSNEAKLAVKIGTRGNHIPGACLRACVRALF